MKIALIKGLIFSLLTLFVIACKKNDRYAHKEIMRVNLPDVSSLDPAFARSLDNVNATKQLFDGLVELDKDLNIVPSIAKNWEILDSGRVYRFFLNDSISFHPSKSLFGKDMIRYVKASDFVFSLNRLIDQQLLSPGKWVMNVVDRKPNGKLKVFALDDHTLEFHLNKPFPPFLGILSMQYCSVIPPEAFDVEDYEFMDHPIGTGPFKFKYWKKNNKLILLKHQNYFQRNKAGKKLPFLDALSVSFIKDQEVVFLNFLKDELDLISGLKGTYKDELLTDQGALKGVYHDRLQFLKFPYLNTEYIGFQLDSSSLEPPFYLGRLSLRKAICFAIDKEKMLQYLRNSIGTAASQGFIPQGLSAFKYNASYGYTYNLDSSNYYLQAFLEETALSLPNIDPIILGTTSEYLDICEYIQHQLTELGLSVKVEVNPPATNNELIAFGKLPSFRKSWIADYPNAENYLSLFLSKNFSPSGPNYTHFSSETYDQLYDRALVVESDSIRDQIYYTMDSMIMAQAAVMPLFYDQQVHFLSNAISGFSVNPMSHMMLKYAKKTDLEIGKAAQ